MSIFDIYIFIFFSFRSNGVFGSENHRESPLSPKVIHSETTARSGFVQIHFTVTFCSSWHGSAVLSDTKFLIHGGYNGNKALCDTFIFDIGE